MAPEYNWLEINEVGTDLELVDDSHTIIPIGFDFHRSQWERFEEELEPTFTQIMQEAANEQKKLGNL